MLKQPREEENESEEHGQPCINWRQWEVHATAVEAKQQAQGCGETFLKSLWKLISVTAQSKGRRRRPAPA